MGALQILNLVLPFIEKLPTIEQSVTAFVHSISSMLSQGADGREIADAVDTKLPEITKAIAANTSAMTGQPAPGGPTPAEVAARFQPGVVHQHGVDAGPQRDPADVTNAAERAAQETNATERAAQETSEVAGEEPPPPDNGVDDPQPPGDLPRDLRDRLDTVAR